MNKTHVLLCGLCFSFTVFAGSSEAYLKRFQMYQAWNEQLPSDPSSDFFTFIGENAPLSNKLREKWLFQLAKEKKWSDFLQYYKPSNDVSLQCHYVNARYQTGDQKAALEAVKPIWRFGRSQPASCDPLFKVLITEDPHSEQLITQRIKLALEQRNISLAKYLLKQYKKPRRVDITILNDIYRHPMHIAKLETAELHDDYYLYGLKRMISINMDQAMEFWRHVKTKKLLSQAQQQSFLAHLTLYKAMRNHKDTSKWFAKVLPAFYNDALLNWQIRFALKQSNWKNVIRLIQLSKENDNPAWQYWKARALEAQGQITSAHEIYEKLSIIRNYYGFLASLRLKKPLSFEQEAVVKDFNLLKDYQPFLNQIKQLHESNQWLRASRLVNDFSSELPKDERSALAYWLVQTLQWHGKALYLSNNEEMNNQLILRFPLAYPKTIHKEAAAYHLKPELIYAIIRQESTFRENVISHAGAHGLMQVMPATAKNIAQREKIPYDGPQQLFTAQKNIKLGAAYLHHLGERFDHHPVLMAAAYNAGPRQVRHWLENHPDNPMDIWVETLPWHETRNYLQNVIAFYAVYQHLLNKKPDLSEFMKPFH